MFPTWIYLFITDHHMSILCFVLFKLGEILFHCRAACSVLLLTQSVCVLSTSKERLNADSATVYIRQITCTEADPEKKSETERERGGGIMRTTSIIFRSDIHRLQSHPTVF